MRFPRAVFPALCAALLIASAHAADVPRQAGEFTISLRGGSQVKLSDYRGKVVALILFLTDCPHCQDTIKCFIEEQNTLGPRGFQALASATEAKALITVPEFSRKFELTFPAGYVAGPDWLKQSMDFIQVPPMVTAKMPTVLFIDRRGIIRAQYQGNDPFLAPDRMAKNIHAKILGLLSSGTQAKKTGASGVKAPAKK